MTTSPVARLLALGLLIAAPGIAHAQIAPTTGIYGVARGGVQIDPKADYKNDGSAFSTLSDSYKNKLGYTGEIGAGYDFGMFRLEQTIGYSSAKPNGKVRDDGLTLSGRSRALTLAVAGYVDIPVDAVIVPFVGGGIGISRVESRITGAAAGSDRFSRYDDKDYGLRWHADAGVGINVAPKTTVEVSGRYSQTSMLKFAGESGNGATTVSDTFKPRLSSISAQVGVRHVF